jgi:hypothetical protein
LPSFAPHFLFQFGLAAGLNPANPTIAVPDGEHGQDGEKGFAEAETEHGGFVRTEA